MDHYTFYITDYISHTLHLTMTEDIAYRRMLDWCYLHEKPLPKNISEICKLIRYKQKKAKVVKAILDEFFIEGEDGFYNERALEEIRKAKGVK